MAGVIALARRASLVVRRSRRKLSWNVKHKATLDRQKRNPKPLLTKRELRKRTTKLRLMRRDDLWATEFFLFIDPREERYQIPLDFVKQVYANPEFEPEEKSREDMGIPLPPIRLYESALNKMRGERTQAGGVAASAASADSASQKKKKERTTVDISDVDSEFLQWKGITLSKKQKAAAAARKAGGKKR